MSGREKRPTRALRLRFLACTLIDNVKGPLIACGPLESAYSVAKERIESVALHQACYVRS